MKKCLVLLMSILLCAGSVFASDAPESADIEPPAQAETNASADNAVRNYSQDIAGVVRDFLIDDDWKFTFDDERGVFSFGLALHSKMKHVDYSVIVRDTSYSVYAISPLNADIDDADMMSNITEFICRANYGLRNGNFEVDMRDGEIRYKTYVNCDGLLPSRDIVEASIVIPGLTFKRYAPGLLDVIFKGTSAADAIKQCED
ncbi:MAG: hypothetical protein IJS28_11660 [Synergistaceae bacterium]|nr:hypothetical protein [Synergistaceae bacterium]